jgi:hypothetical protein
MRIKLYEQFILEKVDYDDKFGITPELESDVKDIFVELRDEGIEVITQRWISQSDMICITLSPIDSDSERDRFKVESVKEYVMMLIDYMKIKYDVKKISYDVCIGDFHSGDTNNYSFDEFPDEMSGLDTDEFGINFQVQDSTINESFNRLDVIKGNIEDIFVELIDDGFLLDVNTANYDKWLSAGSIYVYLEHKDEFRVDDVKDYIMMLNDYMKLEFNRFMALYSLDYMHSDSSYSASMQFESFPTGNSTDINNLRIHYTFPYKSLMNEGFGDFIGPEFDKIESDVNDMFIDLKDDGAKIWIDFYHKGVGYGVGAEDYMIKVRIYSDRKFSMSDVEEPTRMMVDYFKDLSDRRIDMEYNMSSDYTNTRQREFNPYSFDNGVTIFLIERG